VCGAVSQENSGRSARSSPGRFRPRAAAVAALHDGFNVSGDLHLFLEYGQTLLSSHWNQAFSYSAVQVGPLQLLLYGSVGRSTVVLALFCRW
jgi:hypothetical protein